MHKADEKERLRNSIVERLKRIPDHKRTEESRTLCRQLLKNTPVNATVCGYFPLKTEPDIRPYLLTLLMRGQTVYLPCFEKQKLVFRKAASLTDLKKGELNIPEPSHDSPELDRTADNIMIIVPGRAFDMTGSRLGRGAGGYDAWIASQRKKNTDTLFCGVCLDCQIVREIPTEDWDEKMDAVVTARGFHSVK